MKRIIHHPDIATLMSCAAGSQPEAQAAVVASHLALCPECAREVARMEDLGAALLDDIAPSPVETSPPVVRLGALEADGPAASAETTPAEGIPFPLAHILRTGLDDIPWKRLAPGVWHHPIELSKDAEGDLRLIKVAPGHALPEHGHGGEELTLVLKGSYHDKLGTYHEGDVADLDDDVEHQPVADADAGCICLIASERKARFKGLIARLMQPFTGV